MKIFDTLTQKTHKLNKETVNLYVCGPTVYNYVHLGNIRPVVTFDVLVRYLMFKKIKVNYVHNITDIDDKIIKQALLENVPELVLSDKYTNSYLEVIHALKVIPMNNPRVSNNISGIINYISQLISKKAAYEVNGNVYFKVNNIANYGELSKMKKEELVAGERVEVNEEKQNPLDFTLWKKTTTGITWDSPWGQGRPGWHTECAYLIDSNFSSKSTTIHGGGIDLRFPHHENENAQHYALHNSGISKYWMHVGHLNIDNQKMSKSLNNFIYVKHLLEKYDAAAIRWLFYQNHYRSPLNFNNVALQNAVKDIEKIYLTINKAKTLMMLSNHPVPTGEKINSEFSKAIEDDLNFANATKVIWNLVNSINSALNKKQFDVVSPLFEELNWCLNIYGISPKNIHTKANVELLKQWNSKVKDKQFDEADKLREKIMNKKLM